MNKLTLLLVGVSLALTPLLSVSSDALTEEEWKLEASIRVHPKYPISAAREGKQGSVTMSFSVDPQGQVDDIIFLNTTNNVFSPFAKKALKQWQYPKLSTEKESYTRTGTVRLDFTLGSSPEEVSRRFKAKITDAYQLITDDKLEEVAKTIRSLSKRERLNNTEAFYFNLLQADYWQQVKDPAKELMYRLEAASFDTLVPSKIAMRNRYTMISLAASLGQLRIAAHQYNALNELTSDEAKNYSSALEGVMAQVRDIFLNSSKITAQVYAHEEHPLYYPISGQSVEVLQLPSGDNAVQLRCHNYMGTVKPTKAKPIDINTDWQGCYLLVMTEQSGDFYIREHFTRADS
ncbi:energy transducer TonB [Paraferrimonas haliotis]|uniref:TonB C-terminal domain-containing protein n=1 Tax=Paraferrimonas haliotis TaxID=2013866 RepID=A0AA37WX14_9GAMM|nr:energy transducer TonB [Paraferrimonas haliotis]GLS84033.1 hypothetical protein GCM10007894_20100 [Paraferrimonas haliotis]